MIMSADPMYLSTKCIARFSTEAYPLVTATTRLTESAIAATVRKVRPRWTHRFVRARVKLTIQKTVYATLNDLGSECNHRPLTNVSLISA